MDRNTTNALTATVTIVATSQGCIYRTAQAKGLGFIPHRVPCCRGMAHFLPLQNERCVFTKTRPGSKFQLYVVHSKTYYMRTRLYRGTRTVVVAHTRHSYTIQAACLPFTRVWRRQVRYHNIYSPPQPLPVEVLFGTLTHLDGTMKDAVGSGMRGGRRRLPSGWVHANTCRPR